MSGWALRQGERAAEQMNQRMAEHAEAFGLAQAAPPPDEEAEILVTTADGKGVPMRRPLQERVRRGPRRMKGEKANKKQMAYVGAVYTIDRFRRTADDVIDELARKERAADRPVPQHKQVWAEMTRVLEAPAGMWSKIAWREPACAGPSTAPSHAPPAGHLPGPPMKRVRELSH